MAGWAPAPIFGACHQILPHLPCIDRKPRVTSTQSHRARRAGILASLGLLAFAFGVLALVAGVLQRYDGTLSWGGRSGPPKKLAREENPALFDRVTWGLIAAGGVLTLGGLALAHAASSREQPNGEERPHTESAR